MDNWLIIKSMLNIEDLKWFCNVFFFQNCQDYSRKIIFVDKYSLPQIAGQLSPSP